MNRGVWASVRCGVAIATVMVGAAGCGQRGDRGLFKVAGPNTPATVAAFERIKALAGTWESTSADHPGTTVFAVSSNGSVVREIMLPGTEHEMTNVYHMDGPDLVVTHYCAIGNQPRMRARPSDVSADRIAFGPDGVMNLRRDDEIYMGQLTLIFIGPDTLRQEWRTFRQGQVNEDHAVFEMRRRQSALGAATTPEYAKGE